MTKPIGQPDYDYDDECPYCGGEGWIDDECDCMESTCVCEAPSGIKCTHCQPSKVDTGLQEILRDALKGVSS